MLATKTLFEAQRVLRAPSDPELLLPVPSTSLESSVLESRRLNHGVTEAWREEELLSRAGPHSHSESEAAATPATQLASSHLWPLSPGTWPVSFS